jgi:hypothetical protein
MLLESLEELPKQALGEKIRNVTLLDTFFLNHNGVSCESISKNNNATLALFLGNLRVFKIDLDGTDRKDELVISCKPRLSAITMVTTIVRRRI